MRSGHPLKLAPVLTLLGLLSGCAGSGPYLSRGTTLGTLKTSVSHLEFENAKLKREVAKLQSENREFEDRLVQEAQDNDDLKSRLDDARNLLSQRGYDPGVGAGSGDRSPTPTLPAGQSSRKRRKPPVAQIPGRIDVDPPSDSKRNGNDNLFNESTGPSIDPFGPQSQREDVERWLPVAQGLGESFPKRVR
jgi:hypothetical protein